VLGVTRRTRIVTVFPAVALGAHLVLGARGSVEAIHERHAAADAPVTPAYRELLEGIAVETSTAARVLVLTPDASTRYLYRAFLASSVLFPRTVVWGAVDPSTSEVAWSVRVADVRALVASERIDVTVFDHTREEPTSGALAIDKKAPGVRIVR